MSPSLKAICLLILFLSISGCAALMPPPVTYGGYGGYAYPSPQPNSVAANGYYNQSYGYNPNYPPQYNNGTNGAYSGYHYVQPQNVAPGYTPAPKPNLVNSNAELGIGQHVNAPHPKAKSLYISAVPVRRIKIVVEVSPNYQEFLPYHKYLIITPAMLEGLKSQIEAVHIILWPSKAGGYTTAAGPIAREKGIGRQFIRFSSIKPRLFDLNAFREIVLLVDRLVKRHFYRFNIRAVVVPVGVNIDWSKGFQDYRRSTKKHPNAQTNMTIDVELVPHTPFLPDTTPAQVSQHDYWYREHFLNPIEQLLLITSGENDILAGDISPNQKNFLDSSIYKRASRLRREAMDWDNTEIPIPQKKLLRLAKSGNVVASYELYHLTHSAHKALSPPVSSNINRYAPTDYRLQRPSVGVAPVPTVRKMRNLRNQACTSWIAFYQLDTYALIPRRDDAAQARRFEAARYYMGTLFDPRHTQNEDVAPKNALVAIRWYQWANPSSSITTTRHRTGSAKQIKFGITAQHFWILSQNAIAQDRSIAEALNARRELQIGIDFATGHEVPQNNAMANYWFHKAAEQGNATAESNLGASYATGNGVPQNLIKANYWFRRAAEQGNSVAEYNLGNDYYYGQGVPQNRAKALEWFHKAAEQGFANAQYNLGNAYYNGQGLPQNKAKALGWFRKAAKQGFANAEYNLGWAYYKDRGIPQNYVMALKWVRKAEADGNVQVKSAARKLIAMIKQAEANAQGQ